MRRRLTYWLVWLSQLAMVSWFFYGMVRDGKASARDVFMLAGAVGLSFAVMILGRNKTVISLLGVVGMFGSLGAFAYFHGMLGMLLIGIAAWVFFLFLIVVSAHLIERGSQ